jgi:hypothetical protein
LVLIELLKVEIGANPNRDTCSGSGILKIVNFIKILLIMPKGIHLEDFFL